MKKLSLLEAICKANNVQGGTIHQFCNIMAANYERFVNEYNFWANDMSFVCDTKKGLKKMAKRVSFDGLLF